MLRLSTIRWMCIIVIYFLLILPQGARAETGPAVDATLDLSKQEAMVWLSPETCQSVVSQGGRMVQTPTDRLRLASWNIRWFPIGELEPDANNAHEPTDVSWLICVITWMNVDILSLQEILHTPEANAAWDTILPQLNQLTDGDWKFVLESCGYDDGHHIGFLWNRKRVTLSRHHALWQLNPKATGKEQPCARGYRPGRYAYVESKVQGGADFHLAGVHVKSGPTVFALEDRQLTLNRLDKAFQDKVAEDADIVVIGDFNTIGAGDRQSQKRELKYFKRFVRNEEPGFQDLPVDLPCTEYFRGRGGWLDHVLVSKAMKEVTVKSVRMTGYCRLLECKRTRQPMPLAYRRLSDHCPIIFEIQDRELDGE